MSILFQNEIYEFTLKQLKGQGQTGAEITASAQDGGEFFLLPGLRLSVKVEKGRLFS